MALRRGVASVPDSLSLPPCRLAFLRDRLSAFRRPGAIRSGSTSSRLRTHLPQSAVIVEAGPTSATTHGRLLGAGPRRGYTPSSRPGDLRLLWRMSRACRRRVSSARARFAQAELPMWVSSGASDGSSSLRPPKTHLTSHPAVVFDTVVTVETVTLDAFAAEHGIAPDLLWLDLQGGELDALRAVRRASARPAHPCRGERARGIRGLCPLSGGTRRLAARGFGVLAEALPPGSPQGNVLFARSV